MIVLRLVRVFVIFVFSAGPFFFMPSQLYAGLPIYCCECGTECSWLNLGSWFCRCRGTDPSCPYCQKNDPSMFQAKSFSENGMSDIESSPESVSPTVTESDLMSSVTGQMRGGQCSAKKFSQHILASAGGGLRFEAASFNDYGIYEKTLAFNTTLEK
jgi:hypothetical protein